jgi:hypothetical protein
MHASNSIIKFADYTTVVGLITNNDETAYREEVRALSLTVNKGKYCENSRDGTPLSTLKGQQWIRWKVLSSWGYT